MEEGKDMKHLQKLYLALVCVLLLALLPGRAQAADILPEKGSMADLALHGRLLTLDGGIWSTAEGAGHLQGICCDDELEYMYFSFTDRLITVDMRTGKQVGSVTGLRAGSISSGAHLGCLAYRDGWIYGSLEYKAEERWYLAMLDPDKIVGDVRYDDPGVMYAIHLPDVDETFREELDAGEHWNNASSMGHRYGMGGIDGVTFGILPGAETGSKVYLYLSYGPYGNASRYDNNNQIVTIYDPDKLAEYMLPFTEDRREPEGLRCEEELFVYTGNQTYGIQNLEIDKDTGDIWMMCYGRPSGSKFPSGTMYLVDGSAPLYTAGLEVGQSVPESSPDYAAARSKAVCYLDDEGNWPQVRHLTLKCMCALGDLENHTAVAYGDTGHAARICIKSYPATATTGFISLGDDYYYVAASGAKSVNGVSHQYGSASLYRLDRTTYTFEKVSAPAKLLLSYTMDAADTYEKDGQVYLKDSSGSGFDALVEGTYAAANRDGSAGGALGFRGDLQGAVYDRVHASDKTMAYLNDEIDDCFSYSFWVYNDKEMDRFTPVIGLYRDNEVQEGLYAGVFDWRYRNSPAISVHSGADNPEYITLADGTVSISRPGPGGGDGRTYIHGESSENRMDRWLHYVVVRAGSAVTVYCNGEKTSSINAGVSDSSFDNLTYFEMGGGVTKNWRDANTRTRFCGMLDDVRLYSGALSLSQARELYGAGPAVSSSTGTGAVSHLREPQFAAAWQGELLSEQAAPIVHYRMNASGLADESGNGIHGVKTPWVAGGENAAGAAGQALFFDGYRFTEPAKVTPTGADTAWLGAQLNATGKVTVSFWMKATHENGQRMTVLGLYDKQGRPMGAFETRGKLAQNTLSDGRFAIAFAAASPYRGGIIDEKTYEQLCITDTSPYTSNGASGQFGEKVINTWYHVVGELDETAHTMRLFVDGQLVSQTVIAAGTLDELGYFLIGTSAGRYYEYENAANKSENTDTRQGWAMRGDYVGLVDDVRIYNRILPAEEVEALYADGPEAAPEIRSLSAQAGEGTVTARVTVSSDGGRIFAAAYTAEGRMVALQVKPVAGGVSSVELTLDDPEGRAAEVRAFLVTDSGGLRSVARRKEVQIP